MIIAIDGPAASGKGTLAARLAAHYRLPHLDTGLLYRAVAHRLLEEDKSLENEEAAEVIANTLNTSNLNPQILGTRAIGDAASRIAIFSKVRAALLHVQRSFASQSEGAVLDGRDIGTVICPQADVKIFVTASLQERAARRWRQLIAYGERVTEWDVLADIKMRDERDASRSSAPLKAASDAHLLETSNLDIEEALKAAIAIVEAAKN